MTKPSNPLSHAAPPQSLTGNIYAQAAPSPQQTLDLFDGTWASQFPGEFAALRAGSAALFADPRVAWALENLSTLGIEPIGAHVVELGPLEGGHAYLLSKAGLASVTAIEAHRGAFLKCLVAKELLGVERVNFLYGDAVAFLRQAQHRYDIGFASGFLYHMVNPVEVIELLCRRCRAVFLWTVYWDHGFNAQHPATAAAQGPAERAVHAGFPHTLHRHDYGSGFAYSSFFGGPASHSAWMELDDILGAFNHFGFTRQIHELEANPMGAALKLVATTAD
jgi:hypothetical protein